MSLSPSDIASKQFTISRHGLDRNEVVAFLHEVSPRVPSGGGGARGC